MEIKQRTCALTNGFWLSRYERQVECSTRSGGAKFNNMIDVCFWCNTAKEDGQEGKPTFNDYEPCSRCSRWWTQGILVLQIATEPNGNPPIDDKLFPTGRWAVVSEDDVNKLLTNHPQLDILFKQKTMYINENDWAKVIPEK